MLCLRITILSVLVLLPAYTTSIQVSKPKAVTSRPDMALPYIVMRNFKPNDRIVIKVPSQISLPDPEKGKVRQITKPKVPDYSLPPIKANISDGYDFYFPQNDNIDESKLDDKEVFLIEMHPPTESEEPDYYAKEKKLKTKTKKYNPNKKHINYKQQKMLEQKESIERDISDILDNSEISAESQSVEEVLKTGASESFNVKSAPPIGPKVTMRPMKESELNIGEYVPSALRRHDDSQQVQFQMHGFNGPKSYRFGYDTGKGKNRHFRIEQRDKDGNVEGEYGFYDNNGKMNLVKYTSKANGGFVSELRS